MKNIHKIKDNIYITSYEEIKEGDWVYCKDYNAVIQLETNISVMLANNQKEKYGFKTFYKIILTTDQDLIKDGVQAIDDEFLEWFVKNPSCEWVEVVEDIKYFNIDELRERHLKGLPHLYSEKIGYKIIIPKEEPKQETLEEAFLKTYFGDKISINSDIGKAFELGAKWQQERMYSEEEVLTMLLIKHEGLTPEYVLEQFKKK